MGQTSNIASHCIQCAVACSKKPSLFGRGCGQAHTDTCDFCQLVPDIVRYVLGLFGPLSHFFSLSQPFCQFWTLFGVPRTIVAAVMPILVHLATEPEFWPFLCRVLERFLIWIEEKQLLPLLKIQMIRVDIRDAHRHVKNYMAHVIRNQVQIAAWEKLMSAADPTQAFLTVDFCMKFIPMWHRESTADWYGKWTWLDPLWVILVLLISFGTILLFFNGFCLFYVALAPFAISLILLFEWFCPFGTPISFLTEAKHWQWVLSSPGKRGISWMMNVYTRVIPGDENKAQLATQSHACVLSGLFIPSVLFIFCDCLKVLLANFFSIILKVKKSFLSFKTEESTNWKTFCFENSKKKGEYNITEGNKGSRFFADDSKQDSDTVLALIKRSLELYKKGHPEVKRVYIRSDNGKLIIAIFCIVSIKFGPSAPFLALWQRFWVIWSLYKQVVSSGQGNSKTTFHDLLFFIYISSWLLPLQQGLNFIRNWLNHYYVNVCHFCFHSKWTQVVLFWVNQFLNCQILAQFCTNESVSFI